MVNFNQLGFYINGPCIAMSYHLLGNKVIDTNKTIYKELNIIENIRISIQMQKTKLTLES
jgi:hypothetical protein